MVANAGVLFCRTHHSHPVEPQLVALSRPYQGSGILSLSHHVIHTWPHAHSSLRTPVFCLFLQQNLDS